MRQLIIQIGAEIRIKDPTPQLKKWCDENLVLRNPEEYLWLFRGDGQELVVPTGTGKEIRKFLTEQDLIEIHLADQAHVQYDGELPLYDYQRPAVAAMKEQSCGILQAPCGSGKTQMGIALAAELSGKTLWVTHTQDLLNQSYERAAQYFPKSTLGKITAGKVMIGSHMTFATAQTLCKLDLSRYEYVWDTVIVDECHRLAGTPTQNSLAARHKYGLSATVHRSDGMIRSTFAVLGPVVYRVPDEAVADKTMKVQICERSTGVKVNRCVLDTDGTLEYSKLIPYLINCSERNDQIVKDLKDNAEHFNLVLSDRLEHLKNLMDLLPEDLRMQAVMIDGKMQSKSGRLAREKAIENMRNGKKHFLFASYGLAKEGLDIPRLDRLYLVTPKKDYAVVTQSVGRIARTFDGKQDAICFDYVDDIQFCQNQFKRRKTHYRKAGCIL